MSKVNLKKKSLNMRNLGIMDPALAAKAEEDEGLFDSFTPGIVEKTQISSKVLALSEIEEYEKNPRHADASVRDSVLEDSYKQSGEKEEIRVIHIRKGDRYIICDGHRRYKILKRNNGENHKIKVIVTDTFDDFDESAELEINNTIGRTDGAKQKLTVYETLIWAVDRCALFDRVRPREDGKPHEINMKDVYQGMMSKSKADKLARIIKTIPRSVWGTLPDRGELLDKSIEKEEAVEDKVPDISFKTYDAVSLALNKIDDERLKSRMLELLAGGEFSNPDDVTDFVEARKDLEHVLPKNTENRDDVLDIAIGEAFQEKKKAREKEKIAKADSAAKLDGNARYVSQLDKSLSKSKEIVGMIRFGELTDRERKELKDQFQHFILFLKENIEVIEGFTK